MITMRVILHFTNLQHILIVFSKIILHLRTAVPFQLLKFEGHHLMTADEPYKRDTTEDLVEFIQDPTSNHQPIVKS